MSDLRMNEGKKLPTWREMNMDTTPEVEEVLFRMWRETPPWRKWQMMDDLNQSAKQLAQIGFEKRHPNASPEEIRRRLADMVLGSELADRAYGPLIVI